MFSLTFWSTKTVVTTIEASDNLPSDSPLDPSSSPSALSPPEGPHTTTEGSGDNVVSPQDNPVQPTEETSSITPPSSPDPQQPIATIPTTLEAPEPRLRKISIRSSLSLVRRTVDHHQGEPMLDVAHTQQEKYGIFRVLKRAIHARSTAGSRSEKRAKESAEIVRALIVGPAPISPTPKKPQVLSKVQLEKVKSELAKPKSANRVILQLRNLDLTSGSPSSLSVNGVANQATTNGKGRAPIHAVCLDKTDEDAEKDHFAQQNPSAPSDVVDLYAEAAASVDSINSTLGNLHVVDLVGSDFGFGQPATGEGILAGAVPTAETVITGIKLITPQLMSLGYIAGQAILPDHKGVYPPIDRMSVLTYWWGFELVLPPPTLVYLQRAQSISKTVMNLLAAMAAVNNGVREILPFIRYISQFLDFEFNTILGQDQGLGVVCAATWVMPAALVPRPWDFDLPPGKPNLIPRHETGPLQQLPARQETEAGSGQPSGELPPISLQVESTQTSPSPGPDNTIPGGESAPPPSVTIVPPTLRDFPLPEVQLQA